MAVAVRILRRSRSGRLAAVALAAAVLATMTGCSQGASGTLDQALKSAVSATETARQALTLFDNGGSTSAVASSALGDMLQELNSSQGAVAQAEPSSNADRAARRRVLAVLDDAVSGVTGAEEAVAQAPGAPAVATILQRIDRVIERLHALEKSGGKA
jgi:hypothetical protein